MRGRDEQTRARALELLERARAAAVAGAHDPEDRPGGRGASFDGAASPGPSRATDDDGAGPWDASPDDRPTGRGDEPMSRAERRATQDTRPLRAPLDGEPATPPRVTTESHRGSRTTSRPPRPPLVSLPATLHDAVLVPSPSAIGGVVLVVVLLAAILGWRVHTAQNAAQPVAVHATAGVGSAPASHTPPGATSATSPSAALPGAPHTAPSILVVDVEGAVRAPGVQRIPSGARVADAITRAGGPAPDADLTAINRARPLVDGELVHVPRHGESAPSSPPQTPAPGGTSPHPSGPIDLNTADATALDALPGIGPALAARIVAWRTEHGRFTTVDELGEVSGIGDRLLERLRPLVRV